MFKYGFDIRTSSGQKVDNIVIMARDLPEAERRLRQMYVKCAVLKRLESAAEAPRTTLDVESLIGLISRHESLHKARVL